MYSEEGNNPPKNVAIKWLKKLPKEFTKREAYLKDYVVAFHQAGTLLAPRLDADIYMISSVPAKVELLDLLYVSAASFVLAILATIYPSMNAAKTRPAETLKGN